MKFKCIIVDDEQHARELIRLHVQQLQDFEIVAECESAIKANRVLQEHNVDLMFLDIEMPVLKGNELLRSLANPPKVVFTTAHRDYAIQAFELDVLDYLLKPITFSRFYKTIQKFKAQAKTSAPTAKAGQTNHVIIKKDRKKIKLVTADIVYIESLKDYITIHFKDGESTTIKQTLSSFKEALSADFIRIHRSFVVNKNCINAYSKSEVELTSLKLPIGDSYKTEVEEFLAALF